MAAVIADKLKAGQTIIINGRTVTFVKTGKSGDLRRVYYTREDGKQDVALQLSHDAIEVVES
jgi:hypothetical protein